MPIYSIDNAYVAYAIGTDLTAFRNADVALVAGELQATDLLDTKYNRLPVNFTDPQTIEVGHMSAAQYPTRYTSGYRIGQMILPMYLQTGVFLYATLGACTTGGTYTHTITLNTSQTPINFALHFEKELSGQDLRHDFLGYMPLSWNVSCGDDSGRWKAKQSFESLYALTKSGATDIAEPSKQSLSNYEWNDLQHASGALDFTFNAAPLDFDIRAINLKINRTKPLWGTRGANGYPIAANIAGVGIDLSIEGYITGDNIRTIMETKPEGTYELDGLIKFYKSATREFGITLDKLYLLPDQDILNEDQWYEKKTLRFVPYSSETSISSVVEDSLDKTYYEND